MDSTLSRRKKGGSLQNVEGCDDKKSIPVVFVLSTGHAGGTLLNLLLGTSNTALAVGESLRTHNLVKIEDQSELARSFWNSVVCKMEEVGWSRRDILAKGNQDASFWTDWFVSMSDVSNSKVLIDKTPSLKLVRSVVDDVSKVNPFFIHLVRDPRAVCYSYLKKRESMVRHVYSWVRSHHAIERYLANKPNFIRIRYEDLCRKPNDVLLDTFSKMEGHFGFDFRSGVPLDLLKKTLDDPVFENVVFAGNRMRHSENRNGKMITLDEEFRAKLPWWRWFLISFICGKQLERYGYPRSKRADVVLD